MKKEFRFSVEFVNTIDTETMPAHVAHFVENAPEAFAEISREAMIEMFSNELLPVANKGNSYATLSVA